MAQSEVLTTWQFMVTPLLRDLRGGGWQSLRSGWREVLSQAGGGLPAALASHPAWTLTRPWAPTLPGLGRAFGASKGHG